MLNLNRALSYGKLLSINGEFYTVPFDRAVVMETQSFVVLHKPAYNFCSVNVSKNGVRGALVVGRKTTFKEMQRMPPGVPVYLALAGKVITGCMQGVFGDECHIMDDETKTVTAYSEQALREPGSGRCSVYVAIKPYTLTASPKADAVRDIIEHKKITTSEKHMTQMKLGVYHLLSRKADGRLFVVRHRNNDLVILEELAKLTHNHTTTHYLQYLCKEFVIVGNQLLQDQHHVGSKTINARTLVYGEYKGRADGPGGVYASIKQEGSSYATAWAARSIYVLFERPYDVLHDLGTTIPKQDEDTLFERKTEDVHVERKNVTFTQVQPGWYYNKGTKQVCLVFDQKGDIVNTTLGVLGALNFLEEHVVKLNIENLTAQELTEFLVIKNKIPSDAETARLMELTDKMENPEREKHKRQIQKEMYGYEYSPSGYGAIIR